MSEFKHALLDVHFQIFISMIELNKLKGERDDLLVTDEAVRGEDGKIIGCRAFAIV